MIPDKEIRKCLTELLIACEVVSDAGRCEECPFLEDCFIDCTFSRIAGKTTAEGIHKFISLAEEITDAQQEASKTDEERRWEAEADYWNVRRCDPEWD